MAAKRRKFTADFKAKVALDAIKGIKTSSELAALYGVHPVQIAQWKEEALAGLGEVFCDKRRKVAEDQAATEAELYQQIGQLKVESDWMKKTLVCSVPEKRALIERPCDEISISRQCELLDVARSSVYYEPRADSELNLSLMRRIDEIYTKCPIYGSPRITAQLQQEASQSDTSTSNGLTA